MRKIKIDELLFKLIIFFPISTILQGIGIFNSLNKILIFIILILLIAKNIKNDVKIKTVSSLFALVVVYLFSFLFTYKKLDNMNDIFYFGIWVLYFLYLKENHYKFKELLKKYNQYIFNIIFLWNIITFISFFFKISYNNNWGGELYFKSFSNSEHRFASTCIFVIALNWIVAREKKRRKYMLFSVIPFIGIYLSGARTYLGVIFIFILCIYYLMCEKKIIFYMTLMPIIILLIVIVAITPMGKKFIQTTNDGYNGFWATVTNSRSIFWKADIDAFENLNFLQRFVGNGYNFVYDVNEEAVRSRIYAHNDIINVLLTYGYIGVVLYLFVFLEYSKFVFKCSESAKIVKYGYYFIWLFNAMFNMVYTYIGATFSLPFILYSLVDFEKDVVKNKEKLEKKNEKFLYSSDNNVDKYIYKCME